MSSNGSLGLMVVILFVTMVTASSNVYTRAPIPELAVSLCAQCYCPTDKMSNPYRINCRSQLLEILPPVWEAFMRPGTTNVDNVHLDFTNNHIRSIGELEPSYAIDALVLDENEIDFIGSFAFSDVPHLKYLSLKSNKIEYIVANAFWTRSGGPSSIEILDLRSNRLHHLDDDIFQNLERLVELRLGGNPFGALDGSTVIALNGLRSLTSLDLSNMAITDLPYTLINPVRRLEELDLSRNALKKVPEVVQTAGRLLRFNLDSNPMTELDAASFVGLTRLEKLNVSFMPNLSTIYPGTFQLLSNLQILNCAHNPRLDTIEHFAFTDHIGQGPTSMQLMNLRHNNLASLSHELFEGIKIKSLDLQENPLRCSCQITWLKNRHETDDLAGELRCVEPVSLSGKLLKEAEIEEPECPEIEEKEMHVASFLRLKETFQKSNAMLAVILIVASLVLVGMAIVIAKSTPRLPYTIMKNSRHRESGSMYSNQLYNNEGCEVYTVTSRP